jgi:drug/metabolite transporter (DMT)-like permease
MKPNVLLVHASILAVALIYGANYSIMKTVTPLYVQPTGLVIIRVYSAVILFWLLAPKEQITHKKDFVLLALCALFGIAINQIFFIKGLALTIPINASVIMTSTPIMVLIASSIILKERITGLKLLGILMGFSGAFLLLTGGGIAFGGDTFWGDLMILANALSYGIYLVIVKPMMVKYKPLTVVKWVFTFGCIYVLPFGIQEFIAIDWKEIPSQQFWALGYIIVFTTLLTYLLNAWALKHISPSVVGYYVYLQPIIATSITIIFRGDPLTLQIILFSSLIFIGVFLVSWKNKTLKPVS